MSVIHAIEYSRSSKAECHGTMPCKGSLIELRSIRYGRAVPSSFGGTVEWRHWGCVTPSILVELSKVQLDSVAGFRNLKLEDQQKVRKAVKTLTIDPQDIPETAKTLNGHGRSETVIPGPSQKKRKAAHKPSSSQSISLPDRSGPSASQLPVPQLFEEEDEVEVAEDDVHDELYCVMTSTVVGVQYYKGLVGSGEEVLLVREPHNQYDRNAIQVKNIGHTQVGHIPRAVAAKLAPLLDRGLVTAEGVIHEGNLHGPRGYSLSLTLNIYGASDKRDTLEPLLIWATPRQRGFPSRKSTNSTSQISGVVPGNSSRMSASAPRPEASTSAQRHSASAPKKTQQAQQEATRKRQEELQKAAELRQMLSNLEKVDDEGRRSSLLDTLCSNEDILNLPLHPNPPGIGRGLMVDLLRHQSQALQWFIEREYPTLPKIESDKPVQFWQYKKIGVKSYYYNIATKTPQEAAPTLGKGALCADSMGLGKTLSMLALIIATKQDIPPDFSKSTLIVVPLSVLSNWVKQIEEHCEPRSISSCVYYGSNRSMNPQELQQFDVVITTYQTVAGEHSDISGIKDAVSKKRRKIERSLFEVQWKRIILDEGHTIRNHKTKMAKAVCALKAQRRWVLSGTPIINSPTDLGSILTFLRICSPLDDENFFKRLLLRPLKDGDPTGAELLRALMSHICIRRTKEMQDSRGNYLIPLPPVEMIIVPVKLHDGARAIYDEVEKHTKQRFENSMNNEIQVMPSNVLSLLTRLRQLALHPGLVPANYLKELRSGDVGISTHNPSQVTSHDKVRLQGLLARAIEDSEECPICFDILNDPRITSCAHAFCLACITEVIMRDPKCPMDRRVISMDNLIEPPPPTELTQAPIEMDEDNGSKLQTGSSAKIDQLIHLLKLTPPNEKSLVFSQFTSFLDKIAQELNSQGIPHVQFHGQMSAKRRQETIKKFSVPLDNDGGSHSGSYLGDGGFVDDDDFLTDEDDSGSFTRNKSKRSNVKGKDRENLGENPKVMLISLKAGALGLNLTVANNVYLMDPWWQEGIESQAIDRCNRIGQKKPVHVYQLVAENTVESKVIEIQERKTRFIQQAFSGIKRTETRRQKKEARLHDLIELFGIRQRAASK